MDCEVCGHRHVYPLPGTYCQGGDDGRCMCTHVNGNLELLDHDPMEGRVHASKKMPYGWVSPQWGSRGWVGILTLTAMVGVLLGLTDLPWPWIGVFTLITLSATELLRTDAIQQWGAVSFTYLEKIDPEQARHLFWPNEDD